MARKYHGIFEKAIHLGVDGLETDVQMTADGHLVLMHDEKVDRTTNGSGYVQQMTLAQLRALDAGEGQRVPLLTELARHGSGKQPDAQC